jgi:hypothetical protein
MNFVHYRARYWGTAEYVAAAVFKHGYESYETLSLRDTVHELVVPPPSPDDVLPVRANISPNGRRLVSK